MCMMIFPLASAMGQANIVYAGQQSMLGVVPVADATYQWDLYIDNTSINFAAVPGNCPANDAWFVGGNTSPTVTVMWETPGIYYFRVVVQDPTGCMNLKLGRMEVVGTVPTATPVTPPPICEGQTTALQILLTGFPPWSITYTENGIPFTFDNILTSPAQIAISPPATSEYLVTSVTDGNGVTNSTVTGPVTLLVHPPPLVTFLPCFDPVTSTEAKPFRLKGGYPLGGIYSGPGVNTATGYFDPASAGAGPATITYKYTNVHNCADSADQPLVVQPPPAAFTCGGIWTDIRDGRSYPTVEIGGRCWFAANLDHGIRIQSSVPQTENCTAEKYCYGNNPANCNTYGALYQWDELMRYDTQAEGQGLCPPGWHIPSETEWQGLMALFGGPAFAGDTLQSSGPPGFHALTAGVLYLNHTFSHDTLATLFWTSTAAGPLRVISHGMNNKDASVSYYESLRGNAFSVRCVRD